MKKILVITIAVALLLISCTKEKKVEELKTVKLTKLYTIEGYPEGADSTRTFTLSWNGVKEDKEGNVFIHDEKSGSIRVFDKKGKLKNNITNTGMGPQEIEDFRVFYFDKDTLCVLDGQVKQKKFLKNGNFISSDVKKYDLISLPLRYLEVNDSTLLVRKNTYKKVDTGLIIGLVLAITGKDLKDKNIICEPSIDYNVDGDKMELIDPVFAFNKDNIFVTNRSQSEYKIKIHSHTGEYLKSIVRKHAKTKFSKKEMDIILEEYSDVSLEEINKTFDYKIAVHNLYTDKNGYLWVQRDVGMFGEDVQFDILKNGELISNLKIENKEKAYLEKWIYLKDKLYVLDYENDIIEVYDYEFE